nr:tuberous sclerosis 2 protein like [Quercus suber]
MDWNNNAPAARDGRRLSNYTVPSTAASRWLTARSHSLLNPRQYSGGLLVRLPWLTARSHSLLNPRQSTASPRSSEYHDALAHSDHSIGQALTTEVTSDSVRDIEPYEAFTCELLTIDIRAFLRDARGHIPVQREGRSVESLDATLRRAAFTIQYHAKWFAPDPLATLLRTSFDAARISSASVDLFAAIHLIETVTTYSTLPSVCLLPVARFIAYVYHQGSRANRLKKLSTNAWNVTSQILQSHLGSQLVGAFLDIIRSDMEIFEPKFGFASTAGALKLVSDKLIAQHSGLSTIQLVIGLRSAAGGPEDLIREEVMELVKDILSDESKVLDLDLDAGWDLILDIVERCISNAPKLNNTARSLVTTVERFVSHLEHRHLHVLANLLITIGRPLPPVVQKELMLTYQRNPPKKLTEELEDQLEKFCDSEMYNLELLTIVKQCLETITENFEPDAARGFIEKFKYLVRPPRATPRFSKDIICCELVAALDSILMNLEAESERRQFIFMTVCDLADCAVLPAHTLLRLRTDIMGKLYFQRTSPQDRQSSRPRIASEMLWDLRILPVDSWLDTFQRIISKGAQEWYTYDTYLTHSMSLLGNHAMFSKRMDVIRSVRANVCLRIERSDFIDPPAYTGLTKSYVTTQHVKILTALVSYHPYFNKKENLELITIFTNTAGSGDHTTSRHCIHALTICCYELPDLMSSYMDDVIDRMSKMVTQKYLAFHVLRFLSGLSRLPDLHRNFTQMDYKKILGVCQSYLQSARGANVPPSRRQTPTSDHSSATNNEEALPGYVYALAHHVLTFWYMAMKRQDRQGLKAYITRCLTYSGPDGRDIVEDQGLVTIDMMDRLDAEESFTGTGPGEISHHDGRTVTRSRLVGLLLVTTETALRTGKTLVTIRRASGTVYRLLGPATIDAAGITMLERDEQNYLTMVDDDVSGRTYGRIAIPRPSSALGALDIVVLPDDDGAKRAIAALDRTPALDSHKAGLIYIGEGQSTETEILQNMSGSPDYRDLLSDIGTTEALRGATFNTQGLDRENDTDGEFVIVWKNEGSELVFHTTTLMPGGDSGADERDRIALKKRHIGNDFVNIIFNDSGTSFTFNELYNAFPSAFSMVYIVITPSARASFLEARTVGVTIGRQERFYKVQVLSKPDYPVVSPAEDEKVLSGVSLPGFVRDLALNECIISLMSSPGASREYPSSWRARLEQLRRIGDRYRTKWEVPG